MSFDNLLDRTCTIQENSVAQDAAMQKIPTWSNVAINVKCRLDSVDGGLTIEPPVVFAKARYQLFMRVQSGFTLTIKQHRIVIGQNTYTILFPPELHQYSGAHHLEVLLELDE